MRDRRLLAKRSLALVFLGLLGSVLALAHLGESGAVPSAYYTALCVVTAAAAIPLGARRGASVRDRDR
mgnify:CR=1 FL=1